jgi:hypothetical protein
MKGEANHYERNSKTRTHQEYSILAVKDMFKERIPIVSNSCGGSITV